MRKFNIRLIYKTNLLILLFGLLGVICLAQKAQTSACEEKIKDGRYFYDCLINEYRRAIAPECLGKGNDCWIAQYTEIIESNPNAGAAYFSRGRLSIVKDTDRAIQDFYKTLELNPNYKEAYVLLAQAYNRKGEYEQALIEINRLIKLDPKYSNAYVNRAFIYRKKRDFDKAIADYNKAIELYPSDSFSYSNRGAVYDEQGDFDKALADYNKAVEISPDDWTTYYFRGYFYLARGEKAKAYADLQKAKELRELEEKSQNTINK
jgi:tetratricopeptide (TPR) repeat protein